jgi:hypothetical protein
MAGKLDRVNVLVEPELRVLLDEWRMDQRPIPPSAAAARMLLWDSLRRWQERKAARDRRSGRSPDEFEAAPHQQ